ncbi:MAG: hypothetical protein Q4G14_10945 [Paracoccus sp. (in: a-proteobacteria)]|nr:hypothetical protein [Paracoccus sp. (in: a-proteobacteria)]MDO5613740.1 hypothetical protein [Paracoccus sp. (in: a-proteobacteria)]
MSGTKSPSPTEPATDGRWPVWKLALLLYPFTAAAVAINLFLFALIGAKMDWGSLTPVQSVIGGLILGVPATWAAGLWVRHLMDEAAE